VDHVTSPTGLVLPLEAIATAMRERGIDVLVDGAHAPGMIPLRLADLPVAYYTGNCHKWLCAPKGAGFLHVRRDRQERIRPLSISHAASGVPPGVSRFHAEFDWTGTFDPSAWLAVPEAIRFLGTLLPGGWPALMKANRDLALAGRKELCAALEIPPPAPASMIGSLAAVPLPDSTEAPAASPIDIDPFQERLFTEHRIRVPIVPWPAPPRRLLRISAQIYNTPEQYRRLGAAVRQQLG
jgi:isopenicillin-N epimerase